MACVPGMPCYNVPVVVYTTYPSTCTIPIFAGYPISSDLITYVGPNLPCSGTLNNDFLTVALQKIDEKICPQTMAQAIIDAITTNSELAAAFCELVSNCQFLTTTTTTIAP